MTTGSPRIANAMTTRLAILAAVWLAPGLAGQRQDPRLRAVAVADGVHVLVGSGGNVGLGVGDDGAFLVGDRFATMPDQIRAAVARLTKAEVRFVLDTHRRGDDTGGDERRGAAGAVTVSRGDQFERMSVEQFRAAMAREVDAGDPKTLPVVTFADDIVLRWGGDDVHVLQVERAHTDGDVVVHWRQANAFCLGDVFCRGGYPFIDRSRGGTLAGVIAACDRVLALADDNSRIIPGHGDLADRRDLLRYRDVLATVRDRVAALVAAGKTIDEVVAARPSREWDDAWGQGGIAADPFVRTVHADVAAGPAAEPVARRGREVVRVTGSDSLLELSASFAERFGAPETFVSVRGGGTGAGFAALAAGDCDVATSTRRPRERELAALPAGVTLREFHVAATVVAVIVHADNPVAGLTTDDVADILRADGHLRRWAKLGVDVAGEPPITAIAPPLQTALYSLFRRAALAGGQLRGDAIFAGTHGDAVEMVAAKPQSIGFTHPAAIGDRTDVRVVPIAGRDRNGPAWRPAVGPTDPDYPLREPMYFYLRSDAGPAAREFVDQATGDAAREAVVAAGLQPVR